MTLTEMRRVAEAAILKYPNIYPNVEIDAEDLLHILDLLDEMEGALKKRQIFEREGVNIMKSMAGVTVCFSDVLKSEMNALAKYNAWKEK